MSFFPLPQPVPLGALLGRTGLPIRIAGDAGRLVLGVSAPESAVRGGLCFLRAADPSRLAELARCGSQSVLMLPVPADELAGFDCPEALSLVFTDNPMRLFVACIEAGMPPRRERQVDSRACIHDSVAMPRDASIAAGVHIDEGVVLGEGCEIEPGVHLHAGTCLGEGVVLHGNAVVGAEGMAFAQDETGYVPFPHLGGVILGDRVAIGANSTVIRGILTDTVIGTGSKIGNQVNVGHNVKIGRNCFISAAVTLCGSAVVEDDCWIAPGVIILNHVRIGQGARVLAGAVVTRDIPAGVTAAGNPARAVPQPR